MKRLLLIVFVLALIGIITFFVFVGFGSKPAPIAPSGGNVTLPVSGNMPAVTSGNSVQGLPLSVTVVGAGGIVTPTRDFVHAPTSGEYPTKGYFYLGYHASGAGVDNVTATDSPPYLIEYIATTQYFNIELLSEPIGPIRLDAEQFLMNDLGVSQSQMCQLNYMLSVPASVNSEFAGKNLGFSFCPGATVLPK